MYNTTPAVTNRGRKKGQNYTKKDKKQEEEKPNKPNNETCLYKEMDSNEGKGKDHNGETGVKNYAGKNQETNVKISQNENQSANDGQNEPLECRSEDVAVEKNESKIKIVMTSTGNETWENVQEIAKRKEEIHQKEPSVLKAKSSLTQNGRQSGLTEVHVEKKHKTSGWAI